ncbi:DUF1161 domain-containing protein [Aquimonas voraii]|uniref:DUF1161 domain-containing protein n=1 Tax=Aquimonas voraii TaxID=265719 RepID=A0A1G6VGD3_9GAMM|nr:DUF1161 domain-containing protein [Aquimonas voraii]SDD51975.1 Protein of unknown function [Aquimonas voraii]
MKRSLALALLHSSLALSALGLLATPTHAQSARKDCEELKSEIAARIEANGVRHYQLQIVEPDARDVGRIVGSCNGGSARIAYQRGALPSEPEAVVGAPLGAGERPSGGRDAPLETLAQHEL